MSLNGLDDAKVVEAYEGAISEPGGWFLLRYESRDEIRVLSRGSGGITEVRNAVAEYDDASPLYGFLKYRRRSVIIKYLPEDCSRIFQARVAVHLNAVCERFSPFDTIFEIATAGELKDSKLSAACSLHTASCSTSSSTSSLRRRRLMEIAEEEEDDKPATKRQSIHDTDDSRPQTADEGPLTPEPVILNSDLASSPEHSKFAASSTSDLPLFVGTNERRPSADSDTYTIGAYPYSKPKVKLGPRPSADTSGRPQAAGSFRPVSLIPAGFRLFGKAAKKAKGKDGSPLSSPKEDDAASPQPSTSDDGQERPKTSSSSVLDTVSALASVQKKPTMTPEKARLMKAMQLREEKKKLSVLSPLSDEPSGGGDEEVDNAAEHDAAHASDEAIVGSETDCDKISRRTSLDKDDSGVVLEMSAPPVHADQTPDAASTDSHPPSPVVDSSEADHSTSTKASSISESTDETIHAKEEAEPADVNIDTPTEEAAKAIGDDVNETPATTGQEAEKAEIDAKRSAVDGEKAEAVAFPVSESPNSTPAGPGDRDDSRSATEDTLRKLEGADAANSSSALAPAPAPETPMLLARDSPAVTVAVPAGISNADSKAAGNRQSRVDPIKTAHLVQGNETERDTLSAPVEKLTPISLIKTPTTPGFPLITTPKGHDSVVSSPARTVSNPVRGNIAATTNAGQSPVRSMSSGVAYLHHINHHQPSQGAAAAANLAKKSNNIGSSISQRIKALEKLSAATGGEVPVVTVRERPSSTFFSVKKREPSKSPTVLDRANSFRAQSPTSPDEVHGQEVPAEDTRRSGHSRSGSVTNRLSMFEYPTTGAAARGLGVPSSGISTARGRPESVSVMARIIRDPNNSAGPTAFEPRRDPSEYNHLELKQSPLLVDHQAAVAAEKVETGAENARDDGHEVREQSKASKPRNSLSIVKGFIKERRKSSASEAGTPPYSPGRGEPAQANVASPSSLSSSSSSSPPPPPSTSSSSSSGKDHETVVSPTDVTFGDDAKSTNDDKKLSRAGRFMRRLSNLSGALANKNSPPSLSPTATSKEETQEPVQSRPSTTGTPTIVSHMGDVNVQFPDNLLWKRRNMSLDSQGYLILSVLSVRNGRAAPGTKRYHLGEFRPPYIPDVEVQELPNSVVLDFVEGSGIQVACEDRAGQLRVLQTLQEAHSTRGTTYGL